MLDDFFENYFKIEKAYRKFFQDEMEQYRLTPNELLVILFLAEESPAANTARDIARYEGVSKALVARSVESLAGRGYLIAERDGTDKRMCHLYLTQACKDEIIDKITDKKRHFFETLMQGVSAEDVKITERTLHRFLQNIMERI